MPDAHFLLIPSEIIRHEIARYLSPADLFRVRRTCTRVAQAVNFQLRNLPQVHATRVFLASCAYNIPRNLYALSVSSLPKHVVYQGVVDAAKHGSIECVLFLLPRVTEEQVVKASLEVLLWRQHLAIQVVTASVQTDFQRTRLWLALSGDLESLTSTPSCEDGRLLRILASKAGYEFLIYHRARYSSVTRFLCRMTKMSGSVPTQRVQARRTTSVRALARLFQDRA